MRELKKGDRVVVDRVGEGTVIACSLNKHGDHASVKVAFARRRLFVGPRNSWHSIYDVQQIVECG